MYLNLKETIRTTCYILISRCKADRTRVKFLSAANATLQNASFYHAITHSAPTRARPVLIRWGLYFLCGVRIKITYVYKRDSGKRWMKNSQIRAYCILAYSMPVGKYERIKRVTESCPRGIISI